MMATMESMTTIDLGADASGSSGTQETSIDQIQIETTEERLLLFHFRSVFIDFLFIHRSP